MSNFFLTSPSGKSPQVRVLSFLSVPIKRKSDTWNSDVTTTQQKKKKNIFFPRSGPLFLWFRVPPRSSEVLNPFPPGIIIIIFSFSFYAVDWLYDWCEWFVLFLRKVKPLFGLREKGGKKYENEKSTGKFVFWVFLWIFKFWVSLLGTGEERRGAFGI